MKVYTKTGDTGETSLVGGSRIKKNSIRIEAYGTIDELNSYIGLIRSFPMSEIELNELIDIQRILFTIGSELANPNIDLEKGLTSKPTTELEKSIDRINLLLPPMTHFILPGGSQLVSHCHIARTICRRAERRILDLNEQDAMNKEIIKYCNRLSDYLFMLARKFAVDEQITEIKWIP